MRVLAATVITGFAFGLAGCAVERAATAQQARQDLIGKSKAEIIACAGVPSSTIKEGQVEVLAYQYDGDVQVFQSSTAEAIGTRSDNTVRTTGFGLGVSSVRRRQCIANFVFENGRLKQLNYSGRTGGVLTQGEQCAFIVSNCVQRP